MADIVKESPHYVLASDAWQACLKIISESVTPQSFQTWFSPITPLQLENGELTIQVPSRLCYEWLDENYYSLLKQTITTVIGSNAKLKYSVVVQKDEPAATLPPENTFEREEHSPKSISPEAIQFHKTHALKFETSLNPKYTFDNLVKGSCNELAVAAARSVSENPGGNAYNPLVIYGNVGLGKTHIVQAIGNYARQNKTANFIVYVSSEKFTIEMVNAIRENRMAEFSNFFRSIDLLIVDDIQFIAGKDKTQEEIFHIFNALHQANKQIVLSCDRPIKELQDLQDRLLSRFQWGLAADLQIPDYETRLAILYRKRDEIQISERIIASETIIPDDVISFVAKNVDTNVRELEGCITRLLASASIYKQDITLETSKDILRDFIRKKEMTLSTQSIEKSVCKYYKVSPNDLRGKSRRQEIVHARQVCMYLTKQLTSSSLKTIGLQLGGRDHSTVIHACQTVEERCHESPAIRKQIEEIKNELQFYTD